MAIPNLQPNQKDPNDSERSKELKPFEFYNKFIRKEGQPVLSEEQYAERIKQIEELKKNSNATSRT